MTPKEFKSWQHDFYTSKSWKKLRNQIRSRDKMKCQKCGKHILGMSVVHHIKHISSTNCWDSNITMNPDNLQTLHTECHNQIHHGGKPEFTFESHW